MRDSPYWNPRHETLPREELEALQLRKLRNLVEWTDTQVPFHSKRLRDAGVTADSIGGLEDLRRIPFMTRDEWMRGQLEHPPYGPILAAPEEAAIRYHMTSGTTGRTPIRVLDSMKDWEWIAEMWCYGLWGFGVRPSDVVFVAFG
ncbi:MAG: phenylacetate--CoA ligase family protein, partial [Actinomycetota bacterium]